MLLTSARQKLFGEIKLKNIIIESDNLIAMQNLLPAYEGKIDVMPIDPPYNTEIDYIEYKDGNYDNGWGNFMQARLEVAYKLLSKNGVMFIHIDENELLSLTMLCGKIFGVKNILTMVWKKTNERFDKNRKEKPLESGIRRTHEYVLLCFKDRENTTLNPIKQPVWNGKKYEEKVKPLETIIDDLGTEYKNQYSVACLYNIINTRILKNQPTIISTNFDYDDLERDYNQRITSRLAGAYSTLVLEGNDIRFMK